MSIELPPRIPLALLPTPLEPCERLSDGWSGPRIWMKRDDLTGFELSGNKVRKLEFHFAAARKAGADTVITFSVDGGKSYGKAAELTVRDASGKSRAAQAEDYTHVRWTLQVELQPGQQADVWYRTRVK